jgi:hypothetical protein
MKTAMLRLASSINRLVATIMLNPRLLAVAMGLAVSPNDFAKETLPGYKTSDSQQ